MAQIDITASDLAVVKQPIQEKFVKIQLLNNNYQVIDSLEGETISGSLSVDANSDMRRSVTLKFIVINSSFYVGFDRKIWMDKYLRIYLGTFSAVENQIIYKNIGTYILDAPTYEYDAVNNSVQVSGLDLMAKLSGLRNGYLPGVPVLISAGENIREVMIDTLTNLGGFTKYVCDEAPSPGTVPTDMSFSQGTTVYAILSALRDIYPNYEIYFDVDGVFHYHKIPTGNNEPIQIDDSLWSNIVLSEKVDVDFQNVKNYIEVYGRTHDPAYFASAANWASNTIVLTIAEVTSYTDGMIYGFTLTNPTNVSSFNLRIGTANGYAVKLDNGSNASIKAETGEIYYCVQYVYNNGNPYWRWMGHLQAFAIAQDDNPESVFNINGSIGLIRLVLYGGEYENCLTDDLAQQRANYELYMHTNMQDTVTLTCLPVNWLEVNTLVEYTTQFDKQKKQYLIKSFSYGFDVSDTMSVTMMRYYPEYTGS